MRKIYLPVVVLMLVSLITTSVNAQKLFFSDASASKIDVQPGQRIITPQKARVTALNLSELNVFLNTLPSEFKIQNRKTTPVLSLPMPDGTIAQFHVWESVIMEEGLANKFPEIKTYGGQGITDPAAIIRFSMDPYFGFHAQILSPNGDVYIDPYARGNVNYYQSYFRTDHIKPNNFTCLVDDSDSDIPVNNATNAGPCRGTQLFTYRIAIACTGEYARAATGLTNPTVAQTLARIVTTINRVTNVYEREIAVRLILVANNDIIVFTNPATDPFTGNDDAGTLIGESQTQITTRIGSSNFDIGHTFSTGGGGLAGLGVVCNNSAKAAGITGSDSPTGDGYDIDYVAHEVGHQFGANHSFNSNTSGCAGNRAGSAAYEVGSGTTMMGYASLCGSDNIQNQSDPYFHSISYDQISNYITTGFGSNCRVIINTGNTLPVIDALTLNNVSIPANTPFTLTGSATDADGDVLTYSWEQWNLGASTTWNGGNANNLSPLFKARVPKTTGERSFPDIAVIRANFPLNPAPTVGGLKGETMATSDRNMRFRLTVRDNRAGGGSIVSAGDGCQISAVYQISTVAGPAFAVTSPNGGESYPAGSIQTITWSVGNTNAAPINTANVRISLSVDGGLTFPHLITSSTPNDGTEDLMIPVVTPTTNARVKIEAVDNIFYDISNANFTITTATNPTFEFGNPAAVAVTCGSATPATASLTSTAISGFNTPINLSATGAPAGTNVTFSVNPLTPGNAVTVTLNNANTLSNGTYTITVTGTAGAVVKTKDIVFNVSGGSAPTITTQPANLSGCLGTAGSFSVVASNVNTYQWQVSTDGGTNFTNISGATSATYNIPTLLAAQDGYIYRVLLTNACNSATSNSATLQILSNPVITTQPVNADGCNGGSVTYTVATATTSTYQWQISTDNGVTWVNVPGATNSTLTLDNITTGMAGNRYRVIVNNACGTTTSNGASLAVGATASITTQPTAVNICEGNNATFTVVATGTSSYQWQVSTDGTNFTNIAGANNASYTISAATTALNGNSYRVVMGSCPTAITSNAVTLTVAAATAITTQPTLSPLCEGTNGNLSVTASNATGYQWQVSTDGGATWTNIAGATNTTHALNAITATMNNNQYRVIVSGACGDVTSNAVTLTVTALPTVTANGPVTAVCAGTSITLSGAGASSYTWNNGVTDNQPFTINTTTTYTVTGSQNGCSNTATITVTVNPVPVVTITATATQIPVGGSVTLTASSTPTTATFIWKKGGVVVAGATTNTLDVVDTEIGVYTAEAEVAGCTGVSNAITLTLQPENFSFITPNPNNGVFDVRVRNTVSGYVVREVMVFDRKGARIYAKKFVSTRTSDIDVMNIVLPIVANGAYALTLYEEGKVVKTALVYINN